MTRRTRLSPLHRFAAVWCAVTIWLLGILAVSPQLHEEVHDDCCAPEHTCAVTLFSVGAENPIAPAELSVPPLRLVAARVALPESAPRQHAAYRSPPGRGPPAC